MKADTDTVGLDHNPILADTIAEATMPHTEAISGHATGTTDVISGVLPGTHTLMSSAYPRD